MDFIAPQPECESLLSELELKLSGDRIEKLQGQAYDAGTVLEELQEDGVYSMAERLGYSLPTGEEVRDEGGRVVWRSGWGTPRLQGRR
jgi:hypothetical protein